MRRWKLESLTEWSVQFVGIWCQVRRLRWGFEVNDSGDGGDPAAAKPTLMCTIGKPTVAKRVPKRPSITPDASHAPHTVSDDQPPINLPQTDRGARNLRAQQKPRH